MISSNDKEGLTKLLENTQYRAKKDLLSSTEYRERFNGERLFENMAK
jgi:hypothetical protein